MCAKKGERIPPTSFSAFTMRDGYPRSIPGSRHLLAPRQGSKGAASGVVPPETNIPELTKPEPKRRRSKGEKEIVDDKRHIVETELERRVRDGAPIIHDRTRRLDD